MVRNLELRNKRLAEALDFDVLAVILANRHARVDNLRNDLHALLDLSGIFLFHLLQMRQLLRHLGNLRLGRLGFFLLALLHQPADFLGQHLALVAQAVRLLHGFAVLAIQLDHFVNERELAVLKLLLDVLAHDVRRLANQIDINHDVSSFLLCGDFPREFARQNKRSPSSSWDEVLRVATQIAAFPRPLLTDKGRHPAGSSPAAWERADPPLPAPSCTDRRLSFTD